MQIFSHYKSKMFKIGFALLTRSGSAGLQFILNIILGRLLGPTGVSSYFLYYSWLNILGIVSGLGLPTLLLRQVSIALEQGASDQARKLWIKSVFLITMATLPLALLLFIFRNPLGGLLFQDTSLSYIISQAGIAAFPFAVLTLCAETLKAQGYANWGLVAQFSLQPIFLLIYVLPFYVFDLSLSGEKVIWTATLLLFLSATIAVFSIQFNFSRLKLQGHWSPPKMPLLQQGMHFFVNGLLRQLTVQSPFILLPFFATQAEIGLFGASNRLVSLASMILIALSSLYSPRYAKAFANGNFNMLGNLFRQSQMFSLISYLPMFLVFLLFGQGLLGISGPEFREGYTLLVILSMGQLVNAATGLSTHLNYMSKSESFETVTNIAMIFILVIFGVICAYLYSVVGIAIATSAVVAFKNILSYYRARHIIRGGQLS